MVGMRGKAMARKGEHPARTQGAHSVGTVAPTEMASGGAQRLAGACAIAC